ncbi:agamous-like MADS-box protein AGL29 [Panicum miliaceum]|uniref:Agamous-like MADS-box protein AGL29 n=1 Tax=Panicum miliaceum TaxID=4540 RepID=A0A3L6SV05_PANMI|nr:agamous-like MADS-box protein AGL29 [Panicum miliaceum]
MVAPPRGIGRKSQGRKRIEITLIKDPARRMVTFSKRKSGFFKKALELSLLCGADVAAVVFSPTGRPFAFGDPSVNHVLRLCAPLPAGDEDGLGSGFPDDATDGDERGAVEATARRKEVAKARVAEEEARMSAVGEKVLRAAAGRFWWEADVEALGAEELQEFARALRRLRDNVQRHADKLPPAHASQPTTQLH